ncbi:MAG: tetratricopeptide repeat protein [Candidatus Eisenbacteria bacterium]
MPNFRRAIARRLLPKPIRFQVLVLCLATSPALANGAGQGMAQGDRHYASGHLAQARAAYVGALQSAPGSYRALSRLSRSESELGELQKGDEQRRTWSAAVEHARAAVKAAPDSAGGHIGLAVALGCQARCEGAKTRLALSREIRSETDQALQLDPSIGRAWHVLAIWNVKLANLNAMERMAAKAVPGGVPKGASLEQAERAFQKAIQLEPEEVDHRLEYGRLLRALKRPSDARRELEMAASLPPIRSALDARYQSEAKELLAKLPR